MAPAIAHISQVTALLSDILRPSFMLVLVISYVVYRSFHQLVLWPRYLSPLRHVPTATGAEFILGHSRLIFDNEVCTRLCEWAKKYGPVVRFFGPVGLECLFFLEPEPLHQILSKGWLDYPRPAFMRHINGTIAGYGLLSVMGHEHRLMKKAMSPAFSLSNLMSQIQLYYNSIDGLIDKINDEIDSQPASQKGNVIHVYDWMSKVTFDIMCETVFGYKADSLHNPENEFKVAYDRIVSLQDTQNVERFALAACIPGFKKLLESSWMYKHRHWFDNTVFSGTALSTLLESAYTIRTISMELLRQKMNASTTILDPDDKSDVMSTLVRARKAHTEKDQIAYDMNDKAIAEQALTTLTAGHETTSSSLAWTLWFIANDQEAQSKLREEVTPVLRENPHPDYRKLKELQWLDCVVMESLRVLPPEPQAYRVANKTDYVGDILVPKGTNIMIPIRVINTCKGIWGDDAEEYKPSRWLNLPEGYNSNYSQLPFIVGPYSCIAKTMAIMEMKAVIASLIANFSFEPGEGQVMNSKTTITMKPADRMPLLVKRIKQ